MLMFSMEPVNPFARSLANALGVTLSPHGERVFPDGERKLRPLVDLRGADVPAGHRCLHMGQQAALGGTMLVQLRERSLVLNMASHRRAVSETAASNNPSAAADRVSRRRAPIRAADYDHRPPRR